jgi:hypothetical protein
MKNLVLLTPLAKLVDAYLFKIAKGYGSTGVPRRPDKEDGDDVEPKEAEKDTKVCPIVCRSCPFYVRIYLDTINHKSMRGKRREGEGGGGRQCAQIDYTSN